MLPIRFRQLLPMLPRLLVRVLRTANRQLGQGVAGWQLVVRWLPQLGSPVSVPTEPAMSRKEAEVLARFGTERLETLHLCGKPLLSTARVAGQRVAL